MWPASSASEPSRHRADDDQHDPVVITGIGMIASVGAGRESVWQAVRQGKSGVRSLSGLEGIPDGLLIGAPVDIEPERPGQLKVIPLAKQAAAEALHDARVDVKGVDRDRFGCAISGHLGDLRFTHEAQGIEMPDADGVPWWQQWLPNTTCAAVAGALGLHGPRLSHSTACASGLVDIVAARRSLLCGQCDMALAGSADVINPLFAAGFRSMKVLAQHEDPTQACRPFDRDRCGFVMGEGAAMFVLERLSHALRRGARIYAEMTAAKMLSEAHHLTGLSQDSETLSQLISVTLREANIEPDEVDYINAHGTGTEQNDVVETRGIRGALGPAADGVCVSSVKSMLGHLVNAAGSVELAITTLALRDGFAPPTMNLANPDPDCDLDCIPMVGRSKPLQNAVKLSAAFGGHLVAIGLRRWNDAATGFGYPRPAAA